MKITQDKFKIFVTYTKNKPKMKQHVCTHSLLILNLQFYIQMKDSIEKLEVCIKFLSWFLYKNTKLPTDRSSTTYSLNGITPQT